jgi:hypothetical protein
LPFDAVASAALLRENPSTRSLRVIFQGEPLDKLGEYALREVASGDRLEGLHEPRVTG